MAAVAVVALTLRAPGADDHRPAEGPPWPQRIDLSDAEPIRDFTPGLEEPALHNLLQAIRRPGRPGPERAELLDRHWPAAEPEAYRGKLLYSTARFWDAKRIRLAGTSRAEKLTVWSTRAFEGDRDRPLQILSLVRAGDFTRLEKILCIGYFYKIRREPAAKSQRSGRRALIDVPVLVGWILPAGPRATTSYTAPALHLVLGATAGVFVLLLLVRLIARRRRNWRSRLRQAKAPGSRGHHEPGVQDE